MLHPFVRRLWLQVAIAVALFGAAPVYAGGASRGPSKRIQRLVKAEVLASAAGDVEVKVTKAMVQKRCRVTQATRTGHNAQQGAPQQTWTFRVEGATKRGAPCEGWAWARVTQMTSTLVATRTIGAGESIKGAVQIARVPKARGEVLLPPSVGEHRARTRIPKGRALRATDVVVNGPQMGERVTIRVQSGSLTIAAKGTRVPCSARENAFAVCARTPSGTKVSGPYEQGALWVRQ